MRDPGFSPQPLGNDRIMVLLILVGLALCGALSLLAMVFAR
jgi:hypothetical protein